MQFGQSTCCMYLPCLSYKRWMLILSQSRLLPKYLLLIDLSSSSNSLYFYSSSPDGVSLYISLDNDVLFLSACGSLTLKIYLFLGGLPLFFKLSCFFTFCSSTIWLYMGWSSKSPESLESFRASRAYGSFRTDEWTELAFMTISAKLCCSPCWEDWSSLTEKRTDSLWCSLGS